MNRLFGSGQYKIVMVGLDNAGKSTILYRLHLGLVVQELVPGLLVLLQHHGERVDQVGGPFLLLPPPGRMRLVNYTSANGVPEASGMFGMEMTVRPFMTVSMALCT